MGQIGKQLETVWVRPMPQQVPQQAPEPKREVTPVREVEKEPLPA